MSKNLHRKFQEKDNVKITITAPELLGWGVGIFCIIFRLRYERLLVC